MASTSIASVYRRPAEWEHQSKVIMAWPSPENPVYKGNGNDLGDTIQDLTIITDAISRFEPVTLLVAPGKLDQAERLYRSSTIVTVVPTPGFDELDLWMRDMGPTFVSAGKESPKMLGVDYNFNGWGGKQAASRCRSVASFILDDMDTPRIATWLTTEGGSLEVDGEGTLIATESSIINRNRNPGRTKKEIEAELARTLGVHKIIWIPGRKNLDITDSHIDGLVRFISPGHVVVSKPYRLYDDDYSEMYREAMEILRKATDAKGRNFKIAEMVEPDIYKMGLNRNTIKDIESGRESPALTYVNYLVVNGGVILPLFGDEKADAAAMHKMQQLYPDRKIEGVLAPTLAFMGGSIHCSTQEVPLV